MHKLLSRSSSFSAALLAFGVSVGAVSPIVISASAIAQESPVSPVSPSPTPSTTTNFSDVEAGYWAQPFIQALAARNIITGFPDGTFKPNQPVDRAEFAAMIQKAFNQKPIRQLNASAFTDVPADYWAASAIEEAFNTGFMTGFPGALFLPNEPIPKVQAIVALTNGLGLAPRGSASEINRSYYIDAGLIPIYAINNVAAATQANAVVNYPNVRVLNPLMPLTRAEAAAHLYQALVRLGQVQPLASSEAATNYVVRRPNNASQTTPNTPSPSTPTSSTPTSNNLVALAASNQSFSTLTSLLKATGLAESLQQRGPFTVFAPTDQAFAALPQGTLQKLQQPENSAVLMQILMYHVVPGQLSTKELAAGELKTLANRPVNIQVDPAQNQISVNDARVVQPNIQASNGVIHAVNEVLLPPNLNLSQLK